jgi:hypothetical protein
MAWAERGFQIGKAVSKWRDEAARHGLTKPEIDRMASAFEHRDLRWHVMDNHGQQVESTRAWLVRTSGEGHRR